MTQGKGQVPDYELDDPLELTTLAQVRAVADPLRGLILDLLLERAASVSELAAALERPKGTVAYHLKVLREVGVVKVVRSRRVRAVEENYYGRTASIQYVGALKASTSPASRSSTPPWPRPPASPPRPTPATTFPRSCGAPACRRSTSFRQCMFELADVYPTDHPRLPAPR